jgi:hypothetical protein
MLDQIAPDQQQAAPAPTPAPVQQQHGQQLDGTQQFYRNAVGSESISVPTSGTVSVDDPQRGVLANHLEALVSDRRNPDAAIVKFATDNGIMSPGLLLQLKFRKDNPTYNGTYKAEGFDHYERPMTTAEWALNNAGNSDAGTFAINAGMTFGDLGNGITGGALEHAFGDSARNRAVIDSLNREHPKSAVAGTIVGGLAGGIAVDRAVSQVAGKVASPLARAGIRLLGDVGSGAAQGAGAAPDGERADGAMLGAVIGTAANLGTRGLGKGMKALGSGNQAGQDVLDAATRLNAGTTDVADEIRPLPGHVSQGGPVAGAHALIEPTFAGGDIGGLRGATQRFQDNTGKALARTADSAAGGSASDLTTVAAQANDATNPGSLAAYRQDSKATTDAIYGRADSLAGGTALPATSTIAKLDELLAKSAATPGGIPGFDKLQSLRDQLAAQHWTVQGLRDLRTSFGDSLDASQRSAREAAKSLWPTLSRDIFDGLKKVGKTDAAKAYRAADQAYAERASNLDVIARIIGPNADLSADGVANRITAMSRTDYDKLGKAMSAIHPDQAAAIRGGLIDSLGAATAGEANPAAFNLNQFGTRWAKLTPQAKAALYSPQTVRDLDDLATLSAAQKNVQKLGNPSRTAFTRHKYAEAAAIAAGPVGWKALGGAAITGRILATPGVARALVGLAQNKGVQVVSRRLAEVARRNPASAAAIEGLVRHLNGEDVPAEPSQSPAILPPDPSFDTTQVHNPYADLPDDPVAAPYSPNPYEQQQQ